MKSGCDVDIEGNRKKEEEEEKKLSISESEPISMCTYWDAPGYRP